MRAWQGRYEITSVRAAVKFGCEHVDESGMRIASWLKPAPPVTPQPDASISPDSVLASQQTDAAVLDLVQSKTLDLDRALIAQIRERIVALDEKKASVDA